MLRSAFETTEDQHIMTERSLYNAVVIELPSSVHLNESAIIVRSAVLLVFNLPKRLGMIPIGAFVYRLIKRSNVIMMSSLTHVVKLCCRVAGMALLEHVSLCVCVLSRH